MPGTPQKESFDDMLADDLDSFSSSLQQMGNQEGYSIFPKSDYQHDGSARPRPRSNQATRKMDFMIAIVCMVLSSCVPMDRLVDSTLLTLVLSSRILSYRRLGTFFAKESA